MPAPITLMLRKGLHAVTQNWSPRCSSRASRPFSSWCSSRICEAYACRALHRSARRRRGPGARAERIYGCDRRFSGARGALPYRRAEGRGAGRGRWRGGRPRRQRRRRAGSSAATPSRRDSGPCARRQARRQCSGRRPGSARTMLRAMSLSARAAHGERIRRRARCGRLAKPG